MPSMEGYDTAKKYCYDYLRNFRGKSPSLSGAIKYQLAHLKVLGDYFLVSSALEVFVEKGIRVSSDKIQYAVRSNKLEVPKWGVHTLSKKYVNLKCGELR